MSASKPVKYFVFGHKMAFTYNYTTDPSIAAGGLDADTTPRNNFWRLMAQYGAAYFCGHEHTTKVAQAYLEHLYSAEAQKIIAKNYYRPAKPEFADKEDLKRFPDVKLIMIDDPVFGGWAKVTPKHFANGGTFDQIYKK